MFVFGKSSSNENACTIVEIVTESFSPKVTPHIQFRFLSFSAGHGKQQVDHLP